MSVERILDALEARRSGEEWTARCPAHDDRNPSLSIRESAGKVLLHCHAGCAQAAVIAALRDCGLWTETQEGDALQPGQRQSKRIIATYDYTDAASALLYQVVRYEPKDFRQRRPNGRGGWIWKKHPNQVLYKLPEVLGNPIVFVVEGERDVESLRSRGFVATTSAGGAKAPWLPTFTEALGGRDVIIWPDADPPGRAKALLIVRALLGAAARIILLDMPGAKDASEWFEQGHSETELIAQVEGEAATQ
jgi:putative DNA primase/helicase